MKKILTAVAIVVITSMGILLTGCRNRDDHDFTIGILANSQIPAFEMATPGFRDRLTELMDDAGKTIRFTYHNAGGDMAAATTIANGFAAQRVDLMFTLGTGASQATRPIAEIAGIPQVFGVITDPVGAGLVGQNLTGSSSALPMDSQVELLTELLGAPLSPTNRVAFIYTTAEDNSRNTRDRLIAAAPTDSIATFGITSLTPDLDAVFTTIRSRSDITAIYLGQDNQISSNMQMVQTLNRSLTQLPIVVASPTHVPSGAIASLAVCFAANGAAAADLAFEILINGTQPGTIPFHVPTADSLNLYVNITEATAINFTIPQTLRNRADPDRTF
ncbi:MAG: ABC transporter substrate-binding protein [Firmicutes bacterium]|nr:ABC transporter substrate-binding protein [Bacillota bacterium]